ncbi:MAG: hypothetical protein J1E42_08570, partial [Akkermansiaceae bacterium]|nr:hypothetical protein [Akkermansiaceae bacterium]
NLQLSLVVVYTTDEADLILGISDIYIRYFNAYKIKCKKKNNIFFKIAVFFGRGKPWLAWVTLREGVLCWALPFSISAGYACCWGAWEGVPPWVWIPPHSR